MKKVLLGIVIVLSIFNIVAPFKYRSMINCKTAKNDVYLYIDKYAKIEMGFCKTEQCIIDIVEKEQEDLAKLEAKYGDCK